MSFGRCLTSIFRCSVRHDTHVRLGQNRQAFGIFRHLHDEAKGEPVFDRKFMANIWVLEDTKKRAQKRVKDDQKSSRRVSEILHIRMDISITSSALKGNSCSQRNATVKQKPVSPSATENPNATTPEEVQISPLLARSNLMITRDIEWGNIAVDFWQKNRYDIKDVCYPESSVGFIQEESHLILRQLLRNRRPLVASVFNASGNELFKVRRPFWWINSSVYVEVNGKEIGAVHAQWHLWKRIYNLYTGSKQFAVVKNSGFWDRRIWIYTLKDINGNVLAEIEKNWRGAKYELLTDAGQYVIRFESSESNSDSDSSSDEKDEELEIDRPLTLSERAVTLALAISLDNDYFSFNGGGLLSFIYRWFF